MREEIIDYRTVGPKASCRATGEMLLRAVEACLDFASKEEVRYYLCGALFEVNAMGNAGRLTATDGHGLVSMTFGSAHFKLNDEVPAKAIISTSGLKAIKQYIKRHAPTASKRRMMSFYLTASPREALFERTASDGGKVQEWRSCKPTACIAINGSDEDPANLDCIDGVYPDWRRIVPQDTWGAEGKLYGGTMLIEGKSFSLTSWLGVLKILYDGFKPNRATLSVTFEKGERARFAYSGECVDALLYDESFPEGQSLLTIGLMASNLARAAKHCQWNTADRGRVATMRFFTAGAASDPVRFYMNNDPNDVCVIMPCRI